MVYHIKLSFLSVVAAKGTLSEETVQLFLRQIGTLLTVFMYCLQMCCKNSVTNKAV